MTIRRLKAAYPLKLQRKSSVDNYYLLCAARNFPVRLFYALKRPCFLRADIEARKSYTLRKSDALRI